ncbi:TPA: hypothetical protein ACH3X2_010551 [Trebouxia sp. C0005]
MHRKYSDTGAEQHLQKGASHRKWKPVRTQEPFIRQNDSAAETQPQEEAQDCFGCLEDSFSLFDVPKGQRVAGWPIAWVYSSQFRLNLHPERPLFRQAAMQSQQIERDFEA